jgi:effector-binding domain-containing protein
MKALKYSLLLLLIAVIGFSIYVAVQPNSYSFQRSRTIDAPVSLLFNKVNDFKNWPEFSPWIEQDPDATITFGDITVGEKGSYAWKGPVLGEGAMQTLELDTNKSISQNIEFIEPFESSSNIEWTFKPTEDGTVVTWGMQGKQDFMTKMFTVIMGSIESETGPYFERGLFKLDSIAKADMAIYSINVTGETEHSGGYYLYNTTSCKFSEFQNNMSTMLSEIGSYALTHNIRRSGAPFVIYHKWDEVNDAVIFSCAYPTNSRMIADNPNILTGKLNSFKCIKTVLTGDYVNLKEAWEKTMSYIETNNLKMIKTGPMIETYITDVMLEPNPANWITEIYIAVE